MKGLDLFPNRTTFLLQLRQRFSYHVRVGTALSFRADQRADLSIQQINKAVKSNSTNIIFDLYQ